MEIVFSRQGFVESVEGTYSDPGADVTYHTVDMDASLRRYIDIVLSYLRSRITVPLSSRINVDPAVYQDRITDDDTVLFSGEPAYYWLDVACERAFDDDDSSWLVHKA